jgi:hypothetical protein
MFPEQRGACTDQARARGHPSWRTTSPSWSSSASSDGAGSGPNSRRTGRATRPTGTPQWLPAGPNRAARRGRAPRRRDRRADAPAPRLAELPGWVDPLRWRSYQIALRPVAASRGAYAVRPRIPASRRCSTNCSCAASPSGPSRSESTPASLLSLIESHRPRIYDAPSGLTYIDGNFVSYLIGRAQGSYVRSGADRAQVRPVGVARADLGRVPDRPAAALPVPGAGRRAVRGRYGACRRSGGASWTSASGPKTCSACRFPSEPPVVPRTGHIYRTTNSKEYIDGAFLIHDSSATRRVVRQQRRQPGCRPRT